MDLMAWMQTMDEAQFSAAITVFSLLLIAAWWVVLNVLIAPLCERKDQQFIEYQRRARARRAVLAERDAFHDWQYGAKS